MKALRSVATWSAWFSLCLGFAACHAQVRPAAVAANSAEGSVLPLARVRLFENGVGYFERAGKLDGMAAVLPVPASHVDDALKTLVVLSSEGTRVDGVEFASVVSSGTARALAGLRLDSDAPLAFADVLESLEGYRIQVVAAEGPPFSGRLIDVQRFERARLRGVAHQDFWLFVVGDDGSLRRVAFSETKSLIPLDAGFSSRLATATDALSTRAAQLARYLRVLAPGGSLLRLGYVAEAPVWRASYRLVLDPARDAAMLQGWALVHNDTDETWADVSVELVNGQPDSFLFPMAAPRYARRAMATPEERLSTVPQLAQKTPDAIWGDHADDYGEGGLGLSGIGEGGAGQGFGSGHGRLGGSHASARRTVSSDAISIGDLASVAEASGRTESMLFSYRLSQAVSLRPHGSALLPFFARPIDAKRLTLFEGAASQGRATLRLVNVSPNTLPAGPVAVFEPPGFSGETVLQRLRPGESVFVSYGVDLDIRLEETAFDPARETRQVSFEHEHLEDHYLCTRTRKLMLESRSRTPRVVAYALTGTVNNARVTGADTLDYDTVTETSLALFELAPGARLERQLVTVEALKDRFSLTRLTPEVVAQLQKAPALDATARAALGAAETTFKSVASQLERQRRLTHTMTTIDQDLERHREHLKAAGSSGGNALDPLTLRIVDLETQRTRARLELDEIGHQITALRKQAAGELERLQ